MILAAIAMQESGCNPNTVGGGGEQGLMQITKDKCGGAPGGNCKDVVRLITASFSLHLLISYFLLRITTSAPVPHSLLPHSRRAVVMSSRLWANITAGMWD